MRYLAVRPFTPFVWRLPFHGDVGAFTGRGVDDEGGANGGGALYLLGDGVVIRTGDPIAVAFNVSNTILANTPAGASDAFVHTINGGSASPGTNNNNLVEANGSAAGADSNDLPGVIKTSDPMLSALTLADCAATDCRTPVHRITSASPAFNMAGGNAEPLDQCGTSRPRGPAADIGAMELFSTAPVAANDSYTTNEDSTLNVSAPGVLTNDTDGETDVLAATIASNPSQAASFTLNSNGSFSYTPVANFNGTDSFTYKASDGNLQSNTATVTITVVSVLDPPDANDDAATIAEDSGANRIFVLLNDTDPEGDSLTIIGVSQPAHGAAVITDNGLTVTYIPPANYNGADSFTYTISDRPTPPFLRGDIATVSIAVTSVPDTFVVNKTADTNDGVCDADCSLREAIAVANGDAIAFSTLFDTPQTITLTNGELVINRNVTVSGKGANLLTISGNNAVRVFNIQSGTVLLSGLTIAGGRNNLPPGGGIRNAGTLTLSRSFVTGNSSSGIFNFGALNITESTVSNNSSALAGGGINNVSSGQLSIINSTIFGNTANLSGGGINNDATLTLTNSTITGNRSDVDASGGSDKGGGISGAGTETVQNTIVAGNFRGAVASSIADDITGAITTASSNLIGDAASAGGIQNGVNGNIVGNGGSGTIPLASILNPTLANNGGPTVTHALVAGSRAINAGVANGLTSDQRGLVRTFGPAPDIGAYELQSESYAFWTSYSFPPGTPAALTAINADADGDGLANGLEQATGHNPLASDAPDTLVEFEIQGGNLILQYERSITIDPAKLFAEQSLQLQTWTPLGITYANLGPASSTTELIQALIPINGEPKKFGRLRYSP